MCGHTWGSCSELGGKHACLRDAGHDSQHQCLCGAKS